jgi:tellurite resistance protein TerC
VIFSFFAVPREYQFRVLFWGIFGALVLRGVFIVAGVSLIEKFDWILYVFGAFLLFTAGRMMFTDNQHVDPGNSRFLKVVNRVVPSTDRLDGPHLFTRINGKWLATPLFAVLILVEFTDVIFAVDSVPAVLAISHEQFIVFSSNAFAILGLRALYFLLADAHARFTYLQQGLAVILAFVGVKMIIAEWYHIPTWLSLLVIALVLTASIAFSLKSQRGLDEQRPDWDKVHHDQERVEVPPSSDER